MKQIQDAIERLKANHAPPTPLELERQDMAQVYDDMVKDQRRRVRVGMGVPPRVRPFLDSRKATDALTAALDFIADDARSLLVLAGGTGCGKTVAACVALDQYAIVEWTSSKRVGRFMKAIDLVRAGTFDAEFWDSINDTPMLVIDDLGTEPLDEKGWALANIAALIDKRYDACLKTILTTNLDVARFKARYCAADGGRLVDRLREAGAFVEFDGKSLRVAP